ncbi:MAG TPA: aldo/keto reductase [Magnetospirillaceae bacterium]|nr:aldo/keto reductase [Magnetospirillaceae bacterium]
MKTRKLGPFDVAEIGLGCMNLSHAYGTPPTPEQGKAVLQKALDLGIDHFDTASLYGFGRNEELVGAFLKPVRDKITLASKGGMTGIDGKRVIDGKPASIKRDCENSLKRLQTEVIDLYYLHRWDKSVPIEDSVGALADLVTEGKIRAIGLSEVSAKTLERAHAVHPIAALQSEYSLWSRNPEYGTLAACKQLGISFVAFSPVARGFLTGTDVVPSALVANDFRRTMPRFLPPHYELNQPLLAGFRALAAEWEVGPAALAIAWLLYQGDHVLPIPGTTSIRHLEEDVSASVVSLSQIQLVALEAVVNDRTVSGPRYNEANQADIDTEEKEP